MCQHCNLPETVDVDVTFETVVQTTTFVGDPCTGEVLEVTNGSSLTTTERVAMPTYEFIGLAVAGGASDEEILAVLFPNGAHNLVPEYRVTVVDITVEDLTVVSDDLELATELDTAMEVFPEAGLPVFAVEFVEPEMDIEGLLELLVGANPELVLVGVDELGRF